MLTITHNDLNPLKDYSLKIFSLLDNSYLSLDAQWNKYKGLILMDESQWEAELADLEAHWDIIVKSFEGKKIDLSFEWTEYDIYREPLNKIEEPLYSSIKSRLPILQSYEDKLITLIQSIQMD